VPDDDPLFGQKSPAKQGTGEVMLLKGQKQLAGQGSHTWALLLLEYVPAVQGCG